MRGIINGLGASIIGFKLALKLLVSYKPDSITYFILCGTILISILFSGDLATRETFDRVI